MKNPQEPPVKWDLVLQPEGRLLDLKLREIWQYRDLLGQFVKREIISVYKQTVLGPLWFFIQPILTTLIYLLVFGQIARMGTGSVPPILFYLSGIVLWNYFSECMLSTSNTFVANTAIFGKVYFPRIIVPLSKVLSILVKFFIQLLLLALIYGYMILSGKTAFAVNSTVLLLTLLVLNMIFLGLGAGLLISSLTTKYRDLAHMVTFGIQLLMFASPVIYPLNSEFLQRSRFYPFIEYNPLTAVIETFRYSLFSDGSFRPDLLLYSTGVSVVLLLLGMLFFNRVERTFMDTV